MIHTALRCLLACALVAVAPAGVAASSLEHGVIYHSPSHFAGWPANEGMWSWGDEILVGYNVGQFEERGEKHSLVGDEEVAFSRSLDGGKTWAVEEHDSVRPLRRFGREELPGFPEEVDFTHPDFAMKTRGNIAFLSSDRGRNWSGPYRLPDVGQQINARTSYLVTGPKSALFFLPCSVRDEHGERSRSFVAETTDGGQTLTFLSWIGEDLATAFPDEMTEDRTAIFSTMPYAARLESGTLLASVRNRINRRKWTDIYKSEDNGRSWQMASELERGSTNPAVLVALGGEKVAAIYGNRRKKPQGLAAKISSNGGKTWSAEHELRTDGRKWDLGYPLAVRRADGRIVIAYYYTTESLPEQHIAVSIWKP